MLGVGVHMSAVRMEATRGSEPLKLELPEGVSHYVGAGSQTQGLLRAAACANSWAVSLLPAPMSSLFW